MSESSSLVSMLGLTRPNGTILPESTTHLPYSVSEVISSLLQTLGRSNPNNSSLAWAANNPSLLKQLIESPNNSALFSGEQVNLSYFGIEPTVNHDTLTDERPEEDWMVKLIWSLLFYPMVALAVAGNLLIMWIIATKPLMRSVMNRYLFNLTLSDFLTITFNASFNFIFMLNEHWPFGRIYCIVNNFIANLTISSSVCTIMLISLDRYYAIVHPLKLRQSRRSLLFSIGSIWTFSTIFSLPTLLYSDTMTLTEDVADLGHFQGPNSVPTTENFASRNNLVIDASSDRVFTRTLCILRWPDGVSGFSTYEFMYNLAFLVFLYVIPLITMVVALVLMSRVLWPGERIGEHTTLPQHALIRSKRKVVCMLICVIAVFALCWLPYHSYFISIYLRPSLIQSLAIKHIFLAFYWFAMANSLFNPIILFVMNRRIRNYILYYLKFTCCLLLLHKRLHRNGRRSSLNIIVRNSSSGAGRLRCREFGPQNSGRSKPKLVYNSTNRNGFVRNNGAKNSSTSSLNSNPSKRKLLSRKDWKQEDEIFALNQSCPPALCSQPSVTSASSTVCGPEFTSHSPKEPCGLTHCPRVKKSNLYLFKLEWSSRKKFPSCPNRIVRSQCADEHQTNRFRFRRPPDHQVHDSNTTL